MGGNGIAATTHSVELSWAPSTSAGTVGYNVYRATEAGGYSKLDTSLVTGIEVHGCDCGGGNNVPIRGDGGGIRWDSSARIPRQYRRQYRRISKLSSVVSFE